jgi:Tfp pilus assembly protein PilF
LELDPADSAAQEQLALCYERKRRFVEAEKLLARVVQQRPDSLEAHVALARVYYRLHKLSDGDREKAIADQLRAEQQAATAPR